MIVGSVKCAAILLTVTALCGCASGNHWMKSGGSRFATQLHTFQREEVGSCPAPDSALANSVSKLKAGVKTAPPAAPSKNAIIAKDAAKQSDEAEAEVALTSDESELFPGEPPFADADADKPLVLEADGAEPAEELAFEATDDDEASAPQDPVEVELMASLTHPDAGMRALGAWRLGRLESPSEDVLFSLRNVIAEEENGLVRVRIAEAISKIAPGDVAAVESLLESLSDGDWEVRWLAAGTLDVARGGAAAPQAVWSLAEALVSDEHAKVRQMAALTLGSFGSSADAVLPHLREALADEEAEVRTAADAALACIAAANGTE